MASVIRTGGKQYSVKAGDVIQVEKLEGKAGDKISIGEVLVAEGKIGVPFLKGATCAAEIVSHGKNDTVLIFKKKRRHNYRRLNGHRQPHTTIKILEIKL